MKSFLKAISCTLVVAFAVTTALPPSYAEHQQQLQTPNSELQTHISPTSRFETTQAGDTFPIVSRTVPALATAVLVVLGLQSFAYGATDAEPWILTFAMLKMLGFWVVLGTFFYLVYKLNKYNQRQTILKYPDNFSDEELKKALDDKNVNIAIAAAGALNRKGYDIPFWPLKVRHLYRQLGGNIEESRNKKIGAIVTELIDKGAGDLLAAEILSELIMGLDRDWAVKGHVDSDRVRTLGKLGKRAFLAIGLLEELRSKCERHDLRRIKETLAEIGPLTAEHVPALLEALQGTQGVPENLIRDTILCLDRDVRNSSQLLPLLQKIAKEGSTAGARDAATRTLESLEFLIAEESAGPSSSPGTSLKSLLLPLVGGFGLAALAQSAAYGATEGALSGSQWGWGTWALVGIGSILAVATAHTAVKYCIKKIIARMASRFSTRTLMEALKEDYWSPWNEVILGLMKMLHLGYIVVKYYIKKDVPTADPRLYTLKQWLRRNSWYPESTLDMKESAKKVLIERGEEALPELIEAFNNRGIKWDITKIIVEIAKKMEPKKIPEFVVWILISEGVTDIFAKIDPHSLAVLKNKNPPHELSSSEFFKKIARQLGPQTPEAVAQYLMPDLIGEIKGKLVNKGTVPATNRTVEFLVSMGKRAVPALVEALNSPHRLRTPTESFVERSLDGRGYYTAETGGRDVTNDFRVVIMKILGQIGPDAAEAIPALEKAAGEDNIPITIAAEDALHKINPRRTYKRQADRAFQESKDRLQRGRFLRMGGGNDIADVIEEYRRYLTEEPPPKTTKEQKRIEAIKGLTEKAYEYKLSEDERNSILSLIKEHLNPEKKDVQSYMMVLLAEILAIMHRAGQSLPFGYMDDNLIQTPAYEYSEKTNPPKLRGISAALLLAMFPFNPEGVLKKLRPRLNKPTLQVEELKDALISEVDELIMSGYGDAWLVSSLLLDTFAKKEAPAPAVATVTVPTAPRTTPSGRFRAISEQLGPLGGATHAPVVPPVTPLHLSKKDDARESP